MTNNKMLIHVLCLIFSLPVFAKQELQFAQVSVPAGFEDLLAPQRSIADIYFGGRFITTMSVTYTTDYVELLDPELLARQITTLLDINPVAKALYGELNTHAEAICHNDQDTGCGIIEPEIAGVIFDESRFRADLFIHPDFLEVKALSYDRYLPDSTAGLGVIQNLSANISGNLNNTNSPKNYTIFGNTFFSYRENSVQTSWDFSRDQNVSINQLLFERTIRANNGKRVFFMARVLD